MTSIEAATNAAAEESVRIGLNSTVVKFIYDATGCVVLLGAGRNIHWGAGQSSEWTVEEAVYQLVELRGP